MDKFEELYVKWLFDKGVDIIARGSEVGAGVTEAFSAGYEAGLKTALELIEKGPEYKEKN